MAGPLLIVNADDFGLTPGVCQAILRAGACGIVTSTSALANGPALSGAVGALRDSGLGVGAHLALVGHQGPVLGAREVPSLVNHRGQLASGWKPFLSRCALGRIDPAVILCRHSLLLSGWPLSVSGNADTFRG